MKSISCLVIAMASLLASNSAQADSYVVSGSTSFQSALQPSVIVSVPKFDDLGGTRTLLGVLVEFSHNGSVNLQGDNDDPFDHGEQLFVQGQMIRSWSVAGPAGLASGATKIVNTALVPLAPDDGDGGNNDLFESAVPDGHDFGLVGYGTLVVPHPGQPLAAYLGAGTADFSFTPDVIFQTANFGPYVPDSWQLFVENPLLNLGVDVTYDYRLVPEPATLVVTCLGAVALFYRRRQLT